MILVEELIALCLLSDQIHALSRRLAEALKIEVRGLMMVLARATRWHI